MGSRRRSVLMFDTQPSGESLHFAAAFALSFQGSGNRTALVCPNEHANQLAEVAARVADHAAQPDVPIVSCDQTSQLEGLHAVMALTGVEVVVLVYPRRLCELLSCTPRGLIELADQFTKPASVPKSRPGGATLH